MSSLTRLSSLRIYRANATKIFCLKLLWAEVAKSAHCHDRCAGDRPPKSRAVSCFQPFQPMDEGIVAAEHNLCGWNQTRECSDRRSVGSTGNIVVETLGFVFDSAGCLFGNVLGAVLLHTAEHHRHVSTGMGKDELNVSISRERAGKK